MSLKIDRVQLEILVKQDDARRKMLELEEQMGAVERKMADIPKKSRVNSAEYKKLAAELNKLKDEYEEVFSTIDVGSMTMKELNNRQRELNAIMRTIDPNLPQWKEYNDELKRITARIRELRGQAASTGMSISKLADGFNKYGAMAASAVASLTGLTLTMRMCVDEYAQMEEAESQVIKYTGMTKEQVKQLNEEFANMDTRTTREKLNELAGEAGRLGITSKQGIMEFVDAANQINVALGEDLGEDAVKNIGKLAMMFGEDKDMGLRGAMLATGSAINEVAQNSSAAEGFLVDFTARVAGVAHQAGISQADIIGFAASMDENMLRNETSATAYQNILMKMFTDTEKFAQVAGLNVQEFAKLVRTDANEAMLTFAKSLSQKGGMADLAPIFGDLKTEGAGVASVLSVLSGKAEEVRSRQLLANEAYRQGTSTSKEYAVQNTTVQAELDKAKERFHQVRVELGEQLLPLMKHMVSGTSLTVKGLKSLVSILVENKRELLSAATAVAAYTLYLNKAKIATAAYNAATKTATFLTNLFSKATKLSPWGLVISGLTAVIGYYTIFSGKTKEATGEQGKLNDQLERTQGILKRLSGVEVKLDNLQFLSKEQKIKLRDDISASISELDELISQGMIDNKKWYESQKASLMKAAGDNVILQKGYLRGLDHDLNERMQVIAGYLDKKKKLQAELDKLPENDFGDGGNKPLDDEELNKIIKKREEQLKNQYEYEKALLKKKLLDEGTTSEQHNRALYEIEVRYLAKRKAMLEGYGKDTSEIQSQIYDKMIAEANRLTALSKELEKNQQSMFMSSIDAQYKEDQNAIKQQYLDGELASEQAYKDALLELERNYLQKKKAMIESMGGDTTDIDAQILDAGIKNKNDGKDKQRDAMFDQLDNASSFKEKNDILQAMYDADLITYEQYQQEKDRINEEHEQVRSQQVNATLDVMAQAASAASQVFSAMQDAEISKVTRKYDKQIKAAKKAGKDTTKLEEEKEAAINDIKKKYADKQFAAAVLQVTATTAVTAMEAYKSMAGIPVVGPALGAVAAAAAIAAGAAQIAVAKTQRDEAKGLKSGGYSAEYVEGYTAIGNPDDTAGVIPVHKNEFVANHEAVANPAVRQFLDVFDMAQKDGSIRMLNTTQILEHVRTRSGKYAGGFLTDGDTQVSGHQANGTTPQQSNEQILILMREMKSILAIIADKELVVDSRKVRDGIKRVEWLEHNASR